MQFVARLPNHCREKRRSMAENNGLALIHHWHIRCNKNSLQSEVIAIDILDGSLVDIFVESSMVTL